jgi:hypothetical protein
VRPPPSFRTLPAFQRLLPFVGEHFAQTQISLRARDRASPEIPQWRARFFKRAEPKRQELKQFQAAHGEKFDTVRYYFFAHKDRVKIEDVSAWVPELISESGEGE